VRRFKTAVRGPLGSLGDNLIWVGWRPTAVLFAVFIALAGASPGVTVVVFLVLYNAGHLALRIWGFRVGLEHGGQVGDSLRFLALPKQAERIAGTGGFLLGAIAGLATGEAVSEGAGGILWACLAGIGFWIGGLLAQNSWRWSLLGMSGVIVVLFIFGWFG
jgi:PTS system mannose-specific IID component